MELQKTDIYSLALGAAFLGSGGGGAFSTSMRLAGRILDQFDCQNRECFRLHDLDEISDSAWWSVAGAVGSPAALEHSRNISTMVKQSMQLLSREIRNDIQGILAVETGANMLIALLTALECDLSLVDGDGAGRAVPQLDMLTFSNNPSLSIAPLACVGNSVSDEQMQKPPSAGGPPGAILYVHTPEKAEQLLRPLLCDAQFGQLAGLSLWAMPGRQAKLSATMISGTYHTALAWGKVIQKANRLGQHAVHSIIEHFPDQAYHLGTGVITQVQVPSPSNGFDWGRLVLEIIPEKRKITLLYQNETLLAWDAESSRPLAMAPDLICYLTSEGIPYTNADDLSSKIGQTISLIGVKANAELRARSDIFLGALNRLGYYGQYEPIERLAASLS